MKRERVLVIATDNYLAIEVIETLRQSGYSVWRARDAIDGLKKLRRASPDLVVIERGILPVSREDPCMHIRQACYVPIIALGYDKDPTEMLESGADAYMANPPNLVEFTARVRALLRRKCGHGLLEPNPGIASWGIIDGTD